MDVKSQTYEITSLLIDRLQLVRLWGYGFPDIPLYAFVLRRYLRYFRHSTFPQHFPPRRAGAFRRAGLRPVDSGHSLVHSALRDHTPIFGPFSLLRLFVRRRPPRLVPSLRRSAAAVSYGGAGERPGAIIGTYSLIWVRTAPKGERRADSLRLAPRLVPRTSPRE